MTLPSSFGLYEPSPTEHSLAWFGIHVKSRCEVAVQQRLAECGFDAFLPARPVTRKWTDRVKVVNVPLFPGYVFGRFSLQQRYKILNTPGVARIVGIAGTPTPITEGEILSIQTMVASKVLMVPWPFLQTGQRVTIESGPLAGVEGIVTRTEDGSPRVVVSVTLLQRSVAAEIERGWIGQVITDLKPDVHQPAAVRVMRASACDRA